LAGVEKSTSGTSEAQDCGCAGAAMVRWLLGVVILAVVISSDALSQQSLRELDDASQFEQALRAVDAIKRRKQVQCVISIANQSLCRCLSRKLPVSTYFRGYASMAKQEGSEYRQLSATDKAIVDKCVNDSR
jgi:hypothetical protein